MLVTLRKLAELILDPLYPHLAGVKRWNRALMRYCGWCLGPRCRSWTALTSTLSKDTRSTILSVAATWSGPANRLPRGSRW